VTAALLQLAALPDRMAWWAALGAVVLGAPPMIASLVGARSNGALDNASGVAAVLEAATLVRPDVAIGVLLTSAEELGLAGARAWARARTGPPAVAINCDGVDDDAEGRITIMYTGHRPAELLAVLQGALAIETRVRRMPLGLLTDSVALADRGWHTVTISRGSFHSFRRVHSERDTLDNLTGSGIGDVAILLARASEALA
jgi:Iap family predicted aminopeptidase